MIRYQSNFLFPSNSIHDSIPKLISLKHSKYLFHLPPNLSLTIVIFTKYLYNISGRTSKQGKPTAEQQPSINNQFTTPHSTNQIVTVPKREIHRFLDACLTHFQYHSSSRSNKKQLKAHSPRIVPN